MLLIFGCSNQSKNIEWCTDYEEVIQRATEKKMPVLLFFHGSDWCPPCMMMQREVFSDERFIEFTSGQILFLDVDFPMKRKLSEAQLKHNNDLKRKFGIEEAFTQGYPQVVIIDPTGKVLYQEKGYSGDGPVMLINKISSVIDILN